MAKAVLYVVEAEGTTGWRHDDYASGDLKDARSALKRRRIFDPGTNYRISKYIRLEAKSE